MVNIRCLSELYALKFVWAMELSVVEKYAAITIAKNRQIATDGPAVLLFALERNDQIISSAWHELEGWIASRAVAKCTNMMNVNMRERVIGNQQEICAARFVCRFVVDLFWRTSAKGKEWVSVKRRLFYANERASRRRSRSNCSSTLPWRKEPTLMYIRPLHRLDPSSLSAHSIVILTSWILQL